jgi:hypothetical protein
MVKDINEVTRMQLQNRDRNGEVRPSIETGFGSSSRREYPFKDLVELKVAERLCNNERSEK